MTLTNLIHNQLKQTDIPFVEFMHQALYNPQFGYYSAGLQKFGKNGDFVTAPELTPLFGQTLANQCQQILPHLDKPNLFEFGAGSGRLCIDLLQALERQQCLPDNYYILEVSANLRQRQITLIKQEIPHLFDRVCWLSSWPDKPFNAVIIANEVLDAMPVHRFLQTDHSILESYITLDKQGELSEIFKPCTNERLIKQVHTIFPEPQSHYQSEINLFIDDWIKQCYNMLNQGAVFLLDYGFPQHEYYHPDRSMGTLMCHYRHLAHPNPLIHIGEQDITAHVNFTHVAEAAFEAGFHVAGYTNQASFLLANGLLSLLGNSDDNENELTRMNTKQAVHQLIQPSEMGELFKVIALTKQIDLALSGFQLHDKRVSL